MLNFLWSIFQAKCFLRRFQHHREQELRYFNNWREEEKKPSRKAGRHHQESNKFNQHWYYWYSCWTKSPHQLILYISHRITVCDDICFIGRSQWPWSGHGSPAAGRPGRWFCKNGISKLPGAENFRGCIRYGLQSRIIVNPWLKPYEPIWSSQFQCPYYRGVWISRCPQPRVQVAQLQL